MENIQTGIVRTDTNEESHFAELYLQSTAIREQHSLRIMIESHPLPIAVLNYRREIIFCNERYATLLGFSTWSEVAGMSVPSFFFNKQYYAQHNGVQEIIFQSLLLNTLQKEKLYDWTESVECVRFDFADETFAFLTLPEETISQQHFLPVQEY